MGLGTLLERLGGQLALACLCAALCGTAMAKDPMPPVSPEGMRLQQSKDARILYRREGADLGKYQQVKILDPYIAFEKNWQRDYNRTAMGMQQRVRDEDMERMKKDLSSEFRRVFETELLKEGGYALADEVAPDVLVLRPAIIDLVVNAPDLRMANARTIVRSAGGMTLYLELWDSAPEQIVARIIDRQDDDGFAQVATRASNKAAATDILEDWAKKLRSHLDAARASAPAP